jgi:hypothetical protein
MPMNVTDLEAWADAYIEGVQDPTRFKDGHPLWWAIERFMDSGGGQKRITRGLGQGRSRLRQAGLNPA